MAGRRPDPEERALWRRVTQGVRPLDGADAPLSDDPAGANPLPPARAKAAAPAGPPPSRGRGGSEGGAARPKPSSASSNTLDGSWDRRLGRGLVTPEMTIDLHGHSLAGAHRALEAGLRRAVAAEVRLLLVVTGKPPRSGESGAGPVRGAIRASIGGWLASFSCASRIAAVRNAHPRHGGAGALYLVLRRSLRNGGAGRIP